MVQENYFGMVTLTALAMVIEKHFQRQIMAILAFDFGIGD